MQNGTFLKVLAINNLLSIVINCIVIASAVAIIVAIDALTGYGMGFDILAILAAPIVYIYFGYKLLIPAQKHLWASVVGSGVFAIIVSSAVYSLDIIGIEGFLLVMPVTALLPSLFMYLGLRRRAQNDNRNT